MSSDSSEDNAEDHGLPPSSQYDRPSAENSLNFKDTLTESILDTTSVDTAKFFPQSGDYGVRAYAFATPRDEHQIQARAFQSVPTFDFTNISDTPVFHRTSSGSRYLGTPLRINELDDDEQYLLSYGNTSSPPNRCCENVGSKKNEWEDRKPEIESRYIERRYSCRETMTAMCRRGFHASESMYKRKFEQWGWTSYTKNGTQPLRQRADKKPKVLSPGTLRKASTVSSRSSGKTIASKTLSRASIQLPRVIPTPIWQNLHRQMFDTARQLYFSYFNEEKWQVHNPRLVEENIHDEFLVQMATGVRNITSLDPRTGLDGIGKAFVMLEDIVGYERDRVGLESDKDCGLFSLPAIFEAYHRLVRENHLYLASMFLRHAIMLARRRFDKEHPLSQVLYSLWKLQQEDPTQVLHAISTVFQSCIENVMSHLGDTHLTTLSLWGDFFAYIPDGSSNKIKEVAHMVRSEISRLDEESQRDDDYFQELLGLLLLILQKDPSQSDEAENVAFNYLQWIENIQIASGGCLDEELQTTWKDLKQTLADFRFRLSDYLGAIDHLQVFMGLALDTLDDRDTLALQKLEECYRAVGDYESANKVLDQRKLATADIQARKTLGTIKFFTKNDHPADLEESLLERSSDDTMVGSCEDIEPWEFKGPAVDVTPVDPANDTDLDVRKELHDRQLQEQMEVFKSKALNLEIRLRSKPISLPELVQEIDNA